jgi:hypothetical protein
VTSRATAPSALLRGTAALCLVAAALPGPAGADAERVTVALLDGPAVEGTLESVQGGALTLSGRAAAIPLAEVRSLRFPAAASPAGARAESPTRIRLVLRGDETLRGVFVKGAADAIEIKPDDLPAVRVPFESIRRVEAESAHKGPCDVPTQGRPPRNGTDLAYTKANDAVAGTWVEAGPAGIVLEADKRRTTVSWGDLVLLHVDEPAMPPAPGLVAEIDTVGGTRLVSESFEGDAQTWRVKTRSGISIDVPVASVAEARFTGGAFVYASDLAFRGVYTHFYDDDDPKYLEWMYGVRADRLPEGCPLTVGGVVYRHGFAAHSKSTITVPLAKGFRRFEAKLGIDDYALRTPGAPSHGDVTARVTADGKEVWTSGGRVKGGEPPRAVGPLDVSGVTELVLEVDWGEGMHMNDRADWLDPLLVRAK